MKNRDLIADAFFEGVSRLSLNNGAYNFDSRAEYSGKGDSRKLTRMFCTASYEKYDIEYVYTVRGPGVFSMLTFRIIFDRNRPYIKYSPYDVTYLTDDGDFQCYYFSYIESAARMRAVTERLAVLVEKLLPRLDKLGKSKAGLDNLYDKFSDSVNSYYGRDIMRTESEEEAASYLYTYYNNDNAFFASRAYGAFLRGDYNAAYDSMRRMRFKSYYQIRLMSFMATLNERYEPVTKEADSTGDGTAAMKTQMLRSLAASLIMTVPAALFFIALYYIVSLIIYRGAVWADAFFFPNALPYAGICVLPALVLGRYARPLTLLPLGAERRRYLSDLDRITDVYSGRQGCATFLLGAFIVWAVVVVMISANRHAAFYDDGIRLPDEESVFSADNYAYTDVEKLVKAEGAYDIYGKYRKSKSYYIKLKNGRVFGLSSEVTSRVVESRIVPLMEEHGVPVTTVRDADDLDFEGVLPEKTE